jgi:hypothetical protein
MSVEGGVSVQASWFREERTSEVWQGHCEGGEAQRFKVRCVLFQGTLLFNTCSTHIPRSIAEFEPAARWSFGARPLERRGAGPREQRVTRLNAYCMIASIHPLSSLTCSVHHQGVSSNMDLVERTSPSPKSPPKLTSPRRRTRQAGVPDLDVRHQVVLQSSQECSAQCQRDGGKSQGGNE